MRRGDARPVAHHETGTLAPPLPAGSRSRCVLTAEQQQIDRVGPIASADIDAPDAAPEVDADPTLAVAAHALSNSARALLSTLRTLRQGWDRLDDLAREELLTIAEHHASHVDGVLNDLLAGTPLDARRVLESMDGDEPAG